MKNLRVNPYLLLTLSLILLLTSDGCKKPDVIRNLDEQKSLEIGYRDGMSELDSARTIALQIYSDFYSLSQGEANIEWLRQEIFPYIEMDQEAWRSAMLTIRDMALIAGPDKNINRILDFLQEKHQMTDSFRDFVTGVSDQVNFMIENSYTFSTVDDFLLQKSLAFQALLDTNDIETVDRVIFLEILRTSYKIYTENGVPSFVNGEMEYRECSGNELYKWITAGAIAGTIFWRAIYDASPFNNSKQVPLFLGILAGTVVGTVAGFLSYGVYCGFSTLFEWIFGNGEPDCRLPNDYYVYAVDCNTFNVQLLNGGANIYRTDWTLTSNATAPSTTTLYSNALSLPGVSAIIPSSNVILTPTTHLCANGGSIQTLTNTLSVVFSPSAVSNAFPPAVSFAEGPSSVPINTPSMYWVSTSSQYSHFQLTWSFPDGGGSIIDQGASWAKVNWWLSGQRTLRATLTNTCTSASGSANKVVQVTQ